MKTVLTAINAKYIHTNLAIRHLKTYAEKHGCCGIHLAEYTINHYNDYILRELYRQRPDLLIFSCYIWNIRQVLDIAGAYKKVSPSTIIILGGPEVSFEQPSFLEHHRCVDVVMKGEGEKTLVSLLRHFSGDGPPLSDIPGLLFRDDAGCRDTGSCTAIDLDELPFPYPDGFDALKGRILYYEASRGCPFNCQYCLSSSFRGVRFRSIHRVKQDLRVFLDAWVRQVKFVDRTFNADRKFALDIWKFLSAHDNGVTNFHFEISADLLNEESIAFLNTVRDGLFQFEIGVQSTNPQTLKAIQRADRFEAISRTVQAVRKGGNIHQHLDLIAGLPHEDYLSFSESFNAVYRLYPQQLQLGFLKVLKGSGMQRICEDLSISFHDDPPYEVLKTDALSFDEILRLKAIEHMVETYYNSARFDRTLKFIVPFWDTPFSFFEDLAEYHAHSGMQNASHSQFEMISFLYRFFSGRFPASAEKAAWTLRFDMYLHEKIRKFPDFMETDRTRLYAKAILGFYQDEQNIQRYLPSYRDMEPKRILRLAHIEVFPFDVEQPERIGPCAYLFDYSRRDLLGNALVQKIDLAGI